MFSTDIDPFTATPAELLADVAGLEPGLFLMSVLAAVDPATLSPNDAVTYLQLHEAVTAWWASLQTAALVAAACDHRVVDEFELLAFGPDSRTVRIEDAVREEVAAAVRWSPATAQQRIDTARLLAGPLAETRRALGSGEIGCGHVDAIVEAANRLPGHLRFDDEDDEQFAANCSELQRRVLPIARRGTVSSTRAAARRAVLAIDADGESRRRLRAHRLRSVYVTDEPDGMSTLCAHLPTEKAHALFAAVDSRARSGVVAEPIDARRADALVELVLREVGAEDRPRSSARIDVVVPLGALLGLETSPAELRGAGPVVAEAVRELLSDRAVDCTLRRLLTDPITGSVVDVGRRSYEVTDRLRDLITVRDGVCRFPGCRRRADRCQIDHANPWDDGGRTDASNLGALCVRHHQLKTHGGWRIVDSSADGSCTWISPHGRRYVHDPGPPGG